MTHNRLAAFLAYHDPAARECSHVLSVWQDGEITMEKGGPLFGQRNLHMLEPGDPTKAIPVDSLPMRSGSNGRILCRTDDDARAAHAIITGEPPRFF